MGTGQRVTRLNLNESMGLDIAIGWAVGNFVHDWETWRHEITEQERKQPRELGENANLWQREIARTIPNPPSLIIERRPRVDAIVRPTYPGITDRFRIRTEFGDQIATLRVQDLSVFLLTWARTGPTQRAARNIMAGSR